MRPVRLYAWAATRDRNRSRIRARRTSVILVRCQVQAAGLVEDGMTLLFDIGKLLLSIQSLMAKAALQERVPVLPLPQISGPGFPLPPRQA
jgi:hypothetical protein